MAIFEPAFFATMKAEGGYSNNPADIGGETYCGISRKYHPGWKGWPILDGRLSMDRRDEVVPYDVQKQLALHVLDYYRENEWRTIMGDSLPDQVLATELFEQTVNLGGSRAISHLQKAMNGLNRGAKLWPDLKVDGQMGLATLTAIEGARKSGDLVLVTKALNIFQGAWYLELVAKNSSQEVFLRGWLARVTI